MELSKETLVQLKHGLDNVKVAPDRPYYPDVLKKLDDICIILGPLCSHCPHSEATMDIIDSTRNDLSWWYMIQVSCRCQKTLKELPTEQIYLSKAGVIDSVEDKDRHYNKITHKLVCAHYPMKTEPAKQQPAQQVERV
jgi:hypothetical protein